MPQYKRPTSQTIIAGTFTNDYTTVDETPFSDSDFMYSTNGVVADIRYYLSNLTTISTTGNVTLRVRLCKTNAGLLDSAGNTVTVTLSLNNASNDAAIVSSAGLSISSPFAEYTISTPASNIEPILNGFYVRVQISTATGGNAANKRGAGISFVEVELPDAPGFVGVSNGVAVGSATFRGTSNQTSSSVSTSTGTSSLAGIFRSNGQALANANSSSSTLTLARYSGSVEAGASIASSFAGMLNSTGTSNGVASNAVVPNVEVYAPLVWLNFNEAISSTPTNSGTASISVTGSSVTSNTTTKFGNTLFVDSPSTQLFATLGSSPITSGLRVSFLVYPTAYSPGSYVSLTRVFLSNTTLGLTEDITIGFYNGSGDDAFGIYSGNFGSMYTTKPGGSPTSYRDSLKNKWSFIEMVIVNDTVYVYVDSNLEHECVINTIIGYEITEFYINGYTSGSETFTGSVEDFVIELNPSSNASRYTVPMVEYAPPVSELYTTSLIAKSRQAASTSASSSASTTLQAVLNQVGVSTFVMAQDYADDYVDDYYVDFNNVSAYLLGLANTMAAANAGAIASSMFTGLAPQQASSSSVSVGNASFGGIASYLANSTGTSVLNANSIALAIQTGLTNGSSIANSYISKVALFTGSSTSFANTSNEFQANASQIAASVGSSIAIATHNGISRQNGESFASAIVGAGFTGVKNVSGSMASSSLIISSIVAQARYLGTSASTSSSTSTLTAAASMAGAGISYSVVGGLLNATARYAASSTGVSTAASTLYGRAGFVGYSTGVTTLTGSYGFIADINAVSRGYTWANAVHSAFVNLLGLSNSSSSTSTTLKGTAKYVGDADAFATASTVLRGWAFQRGVVLSESDVEAIFKAYAGHVGTAAGVGRGSTDIRGTSRQVGTSSVESFALSALRGFAAQEGTTIAQAISMGVGAASATAKALNATVVNVTAYSLDTYVSYSGTALVNTASIALVDGSSLARVSDTTVIESINTDIYNGLVVATPGAITVIDGARVLVPFGYVFGRATIDKVSQSTIPGYGDITISTLPASTTRTRPTDADQLRIIRQKADPTPKKSIVS